MKVNLVCVKCKEPHLTRDASTQWNPKTGVWELSELSDIIWCDVCEEEVECYEEEYFEFKFCPFCGEKKHMALLSDGLWHYVICLNCDSRGSESSSPEGATLLWNTRKEA